MYNNVTLTDQIIAAFEKLEDQSLKISQVVSYIKKFLKKNDVSTIVTTDKSETVDVGDIVLAAFYDHQADENDEVPFEVVLLTNPKTTEILWDRDEWREFAINLIDYLEHELIHQHQYRARDFIPNREYTSDHPDNKVREAQQYLGNPDEVDAYAFNLSKELVRKSQGFDQALRLIRSFAQTAISKDQAGRLLSPALYGYIKEFEFDNRHPVIKRLMKKTYQNIMLQKRNAQRQERIQSRNKDIEKQRQEIEEKRALDEKKGRTYTAVTEIK